MSGGEFVYARKFIILKDELMNIPGLKPKGHGLIEARENKGKMTINVDRGEKENYYYIYLVGIDGKKVIETKVGRVVTDNRGRGNIEVYFNSKNVEGTNYSIDKFKGIIVRRGDKILLSGYIDKDDGTMKRYVSTLEREIYEEEEVQEEKVEAEEEKIEIQEEEVEVEEFIMHKEEIEEEKIEEEDKFISKKEPKYDHIEYAKRVDYKNQMSNYLLSILRFFPYVSPFKVELQGYDWWRIDYDEVNAYRGFLPFYNYLYMYNTYPFMAKTTNCQMLIRKYGHYLFGMYKGHKDIEYYLYGVPGNFSIQEHPFNGVTGFNTWYESKDEIGYWIIYIDPLTGKVIYPLNPMIPSC